MVMKGIRFVDFRKAVSAGVLHEHEIRIKNKKDYVITFNTKLAKTLLERGYKYVRVGIKDEDNTLYLVFNHSEGYPIRDQSKYRVFHINGKAMTNYICEHFKVKDDVLKFHISDNLSNNSSFATYKIEPLKM